MSKENRKGKLFGDDQYIFIALFVLVMVVLCSFLFVRYRWASDGLRSLKREMGSRILMEEAAKPKGFRAKVASHFVVPKDEEPAVTTITNQKTLAEKNPFFKDAMDNSDRLVYFFSNGLGLIYREKDDVLVNVGYPKLDTAQLESLKKENENPNFKADAVKEEVKVEVKKEFRNRKK